MGQFFSQNLGCKWICDQNGLPQMDVIAKNKTFWHKEIFIRSTIDLFPNKM